MRLHLGIVYKDGKMINHRSLLKWFLIQYLDILDFVLVHHMM